jgi:hypothetical protein
MIRGAVGRLCGLCLLFTGVSAADPAVVAEVDGRPITLRQVEDALLKQEGAELVADFLSKRMEMLDWASLADEDLLVQVGKVALTRRQLADIMVRAKGAGGVRQELVEIAIVDRALEREGILVTESVLDQALARLERRFQADSAAKMPEGQRVDFATFLRTSKRMTLAEFRASPGFRMLAGLQALVIKRARATLAEPEVAAFFAANPERFRLKEALDLQLLFMPWRTEPGVGGTQVVPAGEYERLSGVASQLFGTIARNEVTFERAWTAFGKTWDPEAGQDGRIGWVARDGSRAQPGSRPVPAGVIERAWDAGPALPQLLPPIPADSGVSIVRVLGRRAERAPDLVTMREDVINALIEDGLEARTQSVLSELRAQTPVKMHSLPDAAERQARP